MRLLDALASYLLQLQADGRSEHTIAQYRRHLTLLATWLDQVGGEDELDAIDHGTLARFLTSPEACLRPDGISKRATAMNSLRSSIRAFFAWHHDAGLLGANPARLVRAARCSPPPPRALSEREQERLLAALDADDSDEGVRDRVLFTFMLRTGLRVGVTLALRVEDIDLDQHVIHVEKNKGGFRDRVVMPRNVTEMLREWIAIGSTCWLFPGRRGRPLGTRHVQRRFELLRERLGFARQPTPHSLRHSFAMGLYQKTSDLFLVQRALCHRSISSTTCYARADERDLRAALGA